MTVPFGMLNELPGPDNFAPLDTSNDVCACSVTKLGDCWKVLVHFLNRWNSRHIRMQNVCLSLGRNWILFYLISVKNASALRVKNASALLHYLNQVLRATSTPWGRSPTCRATTRPSAASIFPEDILAGTLDRRRCTNGIRSVPEMNQKCIALLSHT